MNYSLRLKGLRAVLERKKIDAMVISNLTNVRYLCAYTGTAGMAVITAEGAWFVTDFRYQAQAAQQVPAPYKVIIAEGGLWKEAAKILRRERAEFIGFESEHTSVSALHEIEQLIKPAQAQA